MTSFFQSHWCSSYIFVARNLLKLLMLSVQWAPQESRDTHVCEVLWAGGQWTSRFRHSLSTGIGDSTGMVWLQISFQIFHCFLAVLLDVLHCLMFGKIHISPDVWIYVIFSLKFCLGLWKSSHLVTRVIWASNLHKFLSQPQKANVPLSHPSRWCSAYELDFCLFVCFYCSVKLARAVQSQ